MGLRFRQDDGEQWVLTPEQVAQIRVEGAPRRINIPEARRYADLRSVWADLDIAIACLNRLIAIRESPQKDEDGVLEHCYWITAMVHYMRCFTKGHRKTGLSSDLVARKLPNHASLHRWLRNMRNKHLAHDENPYQQFIGSVVIRHSPDGRVLVSPNVAARWVIAVDGERARMMKELFQEVGKIVDLSLAEAQLEFTRAVARLSISEIQTLPEVDLPEPTTDDAGHGRVPD
jgi:hypothetical protein